MEMFPWIDGVKFSLGDSSIRQPRGPRGDKFAVRMTPWTGRLKGSSFQAQASFSCRFWMGAVNDAARLTRGAIDGKGFNCFVEAFLKRGIQRSVP